MRLPGCGGLLQGGREALEEEGPVGQPGHRVVHLEVAQARLELAPVADVRDRQQDPPPVGHGGDGDLGPQRAPVAVLEAAGAAESGAAAAQHLAVRVPGAPVGGEVDQVGGGLLAQRPGLGAEEGAQGVVGRDDHAVPVDEGHGEPGGPEGGAVVAELGVPTVGASAPDVLAPDVLVPGVTLREGGRGRVCLRRLWVHRSFGGSAHRSLP